MVLSGQTLSLFQQQVNIRGSFPWPLEAVACIQFLAAFSLSLRLSLYGSLDTLRLVVVNVFWWLFISTGR